MLGFRHQYSILRQHAKRWVKVIIHIYFFQTILIFETKEKFFVAKLYQ